MILYPLRDSSLISVSILISIFIYVSVYVSTVYIYIYTYICIYIYIYVVLVSSIRPRLSPWQEITEAAMRGELDFFGSLKSRVALLKGTLPGDGAGMGISMAKVGISWVINEKFMGFNGD